MAHQREKLDKMKASFARCEAQRWDALRVLTQGAGTSTKPSRTRRGSARSSSSPQRGQPRAGLARAALTPAAGSIKLRSTQEHEDWREIQALKGGAARCAYSRPAGPHSSLGEERGDPKLRKKLKELHKTYEADMASARAHHILPPLAWPSWLAVAQAAIEQKYADPSLALPTAAQLQQLEHGTRLLEAEARHAGLRNR